MNRQLVHRALACLAVAAALTAASPAYAAGTPHRSAGARVAVHYVVSVKTSDRDWAGTDGDVWLTINGTNGSTSPIYLDNESRDDFERGNTDYFDVWWTDLGTVTSIDIYFNPAGDSWAMDWTKIAYSGRTDTFPYYYWVVENGTTHIGAA
ncbi:PLAT/LH2 domain-containing protein [Krasilnikovia sp. MM14-A1004]|uniref:PLAT/LH2 domain-containing protein n=1 Tax=Krasilnikovia sp. MM14-A1004 TaxID=3373541 RepID=UPI00399C4F92